MTKTGDPQNKPAGYYGAPELADLIGVSRPTFDRTIKPRLGGGDVIRAGRWLWYRGAAAVAIYIRNQVDREVVKFFPTADALLVGAAVGNSPGLEKYRAARGSLAEIELAERQRQSVPMSELKTGLMRLAQVLKTTGELLGQEHGAAAQQKMTDALHGFLAEVTRTCGDAK